MTRVYLVRHGETGGNKMETFRGTLDLPLTQKGKEQAFRAAVIFTKHNPDAVYSSPLRRAEDTADAIAEPHILPVLKESRFMDLDFGKWQGKTVGGVKEEFPCEFEQWTKNPFNAVISGGGNLKELAKNASDALCEIIERHKDREVIIVTHRLVLKLLVCFALGLDGPGFWKIRMDCGSISLLEHDGENFILSLLNGTSHLEGMEPGTADV
ncbi:MAG: histidine phosphatase family protein [Chloroflexi bacterium]|nr:histidine phosphatase family protein [Chloroflexota bacterium]